MTGSVNNTLRKQTIELCAKWLQEADAVLISAGAGMSGHKGYNVYVDKDDFKKHYPEFHTNYGYSTGYECMGLFLDPNNRVPDTARWGYQVKHMHNMRWAFPPNEGYKTLLGMIQDKDYFVYTSNADGCFINSGFSPDRLYRPQGDWENYQCRGVNNKGPCRPDAVFSTRDLLDAVLPQLKADGTLPESAVPRCKYCNGNVFGNVRGGDWYIHAPYDEEGKRMLAWLDSIEATGKRLVVLEIGCGFNSPSVIRFPMESLARHNKNVSLVRINPTDSLLPPDLHNAIGISDGWTVLSDIQAARALVQPTSGEDAEEQSSRARVMTSSREADVRAGQREHPYARHYAAIPCTTLLASLGHSH